LFKLDVTVALCYHWFVSYFNLSFSW